MGDMDALLDAAIALREGVNGFDEVVHKQTLAASTISVVGHEAMVRAMLDVGRLTNRRDGWQMASAIAYEAARRRQLVDRIDTIVLGARDVQGPRVCVRVRAGRASVSGGVYVQDIKSEQIVAAEAERILGALYAQISLKGGR